MFPFQWCLNLFRVPRMKRPEGAYYLGQSDVRVRITSIRQTFTESILGTLRPTPPLTHE